MQKLTPEFTFMKGIPMAVRVKRIAITAAIGFVLQLFVSPVIGWPVILVAALMGSMKSRSNEPEITQLGDWQPVTIEEMEKARKFLEGTTEIKSGGCSSGALGCLSVLGVGFIGLVLLFAVDGGSVLDFWKPVLTGGPLSVPFVVDALTFAAAIGLSGGTRAWEPPNLRTKFEQMSQILAIGRENPQLDFQPNLQLARTKDGAVPTDCKLLIKLKDVAPNFIGIQVQTSFNEVRGSSLPYTYCVLLAKPEFELTKRTETIEIPPPGGFPAGFLGLLADANTKRESKFARFHGSLIEMKREGEVDIAVVRQDTSEGEGYTTSPSQALEVFSDAYVLAKKMLGESKE